MKYLLVLMSLLSVNCLLAQSEQVWLRPNLGQWDEPIEYQVQMDQGVMMLDQAGFTYLFYEKPAHDHTAESSEHDHNKVHAQVLKMHFLNNAWEGVKVEEGKSAHYSNYYIGNNPNRWKSGIFDVSKTTYKEFYPGIDLEILGVEQHVKYSFIVQPGTNPESIKAQISGSQNVFLEDGTLHIVTDFGELMESAPKAWTVKDGKRQEVDVRFRLKGNIVQFELGKYDQTQVLVIDPNIVFSSFTGSTMDNWGMSATPDDQGNLYAGGIVFGSSGGSYPTLVGSFDLTYNGGQSYTASLPNGATFSMTGFDASISKFNATGTALMFSTYLGGNDNETIHSLVTDQNSNLYVMGVTGSSNFPTTNGAFDQTHNGGPTVDANELGFVGGADIYITRFNANGSALVGSTFVGGTGTDGVNKSSLFYNYGDPFRGEIIHSNGFIYVASSSQSVNFPTVSASQGFLSGQQDAVVFKMTDNLTTMSWSTYYGGSGEDSGNGLQLSSNGDVYLTGGTTSANLSLLSGHDLSYNSGIADGFLTRFSNATGTVLSGTYIGTNEYDQSFFVQLDNDDAVYIYGQSEGTIAITPGCYGTPNSGQIIAKYSTNLGTQNWVTTVGAGSGHVEISPTAFLVSNCKDIYISGWGGQINQTYAPGATLSSTIGFPVTTDAFQSVTSGSNFWIAVLNQDASALEYATFIGGTSSSANHVDGGTSRFDKNGNIYHAVCAACGGNDFGFSTTPGVWSPSNPSPNCNLAAFKFELSNIEAIVNDPDPLICLPDPVVFQNNSANGNDFFWDFGDGSTSTEVNPSHNYAGPGIYTVTLIVSDTNNCFAPDSIEFLVNIGDFQGGVVDPDILVCPGEAAQLEAFGGANYAWTPAQFLNNPSIANPLANVTQNTIFTCVISDSCGTDTVQVSVTVAQIAGNISEDTTICIGNSVPLFINGVVNATWSPPTFLDNPSSFTPVSTPTNTITYQVNGETVDGCVISQDVTITVFTEPPVPDLPDTLKYCAGGSIPVTVTGAQTFNWSPAGIVSPATGPNVVINANSEQYVYCDFTNACATLRDSAWIDLVVAQVDGFGDTTICPGEVVFMSATGAQSYVWNPQNVTPATSNFSEVSSTVSITTTFIVTGTDAYGCSDTASVLIQTYPLPFVQTNADVFAILGEVVQLDAIASGPGTFVWSPAEYLSCVVCQDPLAQPDQNFLYTVTFTDTNGCTASDVVRVKYDPLIYVPNAFTPDGNSINAEFFALGVNIDDFKMEVYNRWGELIYTGDAQSKSWDGTYKNLPCPDGVYVWKIYYSDLFTEDSYTIVGHVSLLR